MASIHSMTDVQMLADYFDKVVNDLCCRFGVPANLLKCEPSMNTERQAFIRAIFDEPDEDGPRLVFADWLDEHGDAARAEFIRVQCERAKAGPCRGLPMAECDTDRHDYTVCPVCRLVQRQHQLWDAHAAKWIANCALPGFVPVPRHDSRCRVDLRDVSGPIVWPLAFGFRRGFVGLAHLTGNAWVRHGDAIVSLHPVREVELTSLPELIRLGDSYPPGKYALMSGRSSSFYPEDYDTVESTAHGYMANRPAGSIADAFNRSVILGLLEDQWPGVTFQMPPVPNPVFPPVVRPSHMPSGNPVGPIGRGETPPAGRRS